VIKVLNVVVDNHIGGIQNRILSVGKELQNQYVDTIILSPKGDGDFAAIARNSHLTVHQASIGSPKLFTSYRNILKNILWLYRFPIGIIETIGIIKCEDVDLVHANGILALHAVFAARITRTPLIWHLISTIYPRSLVKVVRPFYSRWADQIVLITHNTIEYYLGESCTGDRIRIIHEPVNLKYYDKKLVPESNKEDIRRKYGLNKEYKIIGFVGNISPQKGLEFFLQIVKEMKNISTNKIKYLIVGDAAREHFDYFCKLKEIVQELGLKEDIIFTGRVPDIREIMSVMDVFLMTSKSEGTPLVILEAMAMEIPVIAPNVGGISEQISDEVTGFVVPPMDKEAAIQSLLVLLNNPNLEEEMGRKGRERVCSLFSLDRCVSLHKNLYLEMAEHRK
jgi:glycosyltransferase involved in cell wall biosynthesis